MSQAIIMAAGRSTRTTPLTETRPKPLIPIWGEPHLSHQLRHLSGLVDEAIIVVGYKKEQIERHFKDSYHGIRLRYAVQQTARGTADAVLTAAPHVHSQVLVLNGDDFYHRDDLATLLDKQTAILVSRAADPQNRSVISFEDDRVTRIVEKPSDPAPDSLCGVGAYALRAEDLRLLRDLPLSPRGELELPDFLTRLISSSTVRFGVLERFWLPLTYAWDPLGVILFLWEDPARARLYGLECEETQAHVSGPVYIGRDVRIDSGAVIQGPSAIGDGVVIGPGARIDKSVLFEGVHIGANASINYSVLGASSIVSDGVQFDARPGSELQVSIKGKMTTPIIEKLGSVIGDGATIDRSLEAGTIIPAAGQSNSTSMD